MKILAFILSLIFILPVYGSVDSQLLKTITGVQNLTIDFVSFVDDTTCSKENPLNCKKPLTSIQIEKFKGIITALAEWKLSIFASENLKVDILKGKPFHLIDGETTSIHETDKRITITLHTNQRVQLLQRIKAHAALNLALYESFLSVARILSQSSKIRAILQYDMLFEDRVLDEIYSPVTGKKLWTVIKRDLRLMDVLSKQIDKPVADPADEFLNSSWVMREIRAGKNFKRWKESAGFRMDMKKSSFAERGKRIFSSLSQVFGNTVGKISFRQGKLKALAKDEKFMTVFKSKIKPMDILFEKTPFRLTDKLIPGHFGHAALWLGTQAELKKMLVVFEGKLIPLLTHPEVTPFLNQILEGNLVVESLRKTGVTMNSMEEFFNVDDLAIMRPNNLKDIPELILRTLRQVGKPYDFNFDVETERTAVCTEVITAVLTDWEWPSTFTFGRFTVSPDDLARKALGEEFQIISLYRAGRLVEKDAAAVLKKVLKLQ